MIFWISIGLSLYCIFKTKKMGSLNRWDMFFLLSSWQVFNLKIWQRYLSQFVSTPYEASAVILIALALLYGKKRKISLGFGFSQKDLLIVFNSITVLAAILIPLGLYLEFLKINANPDFRKVLAVAAGYLLFVAPSEELIFRGILQNLLEKTFRPLPALVLATAAFALIYTHLSGNGIFPNWTYVGFAFLAGLAYGISYLKSKNILIPILIHGLVDTIWKVFFN